MIPLNGDDIIALGVPRGPHVGRVLKFLRMSKVINTTAEAEAFVIKYADQIPPVLTKEDPFKKQLSINLSSENEGNYDQCVTAMQDCLATPYTIRGQLLPDACPAGVIPVGGVIASRRLHPGYHSADVACSLVASLTNARSTEQVWNDYREATHFGAGGRPDLLPPIWLMEQMQANRFLENLLGFAEMDFGTQGDGNHFGFVGTSETNGYTTLITHHGSRRLGARMYKIAMKIAMEHTAKISKGIDKQHSWMPKELEEEYWNALRLVKHWTFLSHRAIHQKAFPTGAPIAGLMTPHNFVFKRGDVYYHAKGATPLMPTELSLIPLNADQPILVVRGEAEGFAPHGAGRDMSRTQYKKLLGSKVPVSDRLEFFSGVPDYSEFPSAYKNPKEIFQRLKDCKIVNRILPYKTMMAGERTTE